MLAMMAHSADDEQQLNPADYAKAVLNILEDAAAERTHLHDAQRAVLNILEDSASERGRLEMTQKAVLNILGDSGDEKLHLEQMQKAVLNILDDLAGEVDERRRFEQTLQEKNLELESASLSKDRFLSSMSHELRTPLNAIIGFTGTILMKLAGPLTADQDKQLKIVQGSARHLLSLINDMLDITKIESGKVELKLESIPCKETLEAVAATLRPLAAAKSLEFVIQASKDEIYLYTDRRTYSQIAINLIGNAIKFTEKGRVRVELDQRHDNGHLLTELRVRDTGIGIKPEEHRRLFQAFTQLDAGSTRRHEGTGLGLHLSQKLAHLIGGHIELASEFGEGSTFTLTIRGR